MRHPMQYIEVDGHGVQRFRANAIVRRLLDEGGIDLNRIACWDVPRADREQFAQLIGYSLCGFAGLGYATEQTCAAADAMANAGMSEIEARLAEANRLIDALRTALREPMADLYDKHPDDLMEVRDEQAKEEQG